MLVLSRRDMPAIPPESVANIIGASAESPLSLLWLSVGPAASFPIIEVMPNRLVTHTCHAPS